MSAEWIATLADGSEQKYRIEHWRGIPIVELRRKGEPSRSQMRAALKSAEEALDELDAERDSDHGEGCDSCHALALVLAALGARS